MSISDLRDEKELRKGSGEHSRRGNSMHGGPAVEGNVVWPRAQRRQYCVFEVSALKIHGTGGQRKASGS